MTQQTLPEILVATEALESRIAITESEVQRMKDDVAEKRRLLRSLRKALATINPKRMPSRRRGPGASRKMANESTSP